MRVLRGKLPHKMLSRTISVEKFHNSIASFVNLYGFQEALKSSAVSEPRVFLLLKASGNSRDKKLRPPVSKPALAHRSTCNANQVSISGPTFELFAALV